MNIFKIHAPYKPTGDQPQAINQLVKGFQEGNQFNVLGGLFSAVYTTFCGQDRGYGLDNIRWTDGICDINSCNGQGDIRQYKRTISKEVLKFLYEHIWKRIL